MPLIFSLLFSLLSRATKTIEAGEKKIDGKLTVVDSRTNKSYDIPITNNAVRAIHFRYISTLGITATALERYNAGLRVLDPGYQNTAVVESAITHIDGLKGTIQYRGFTIDDLIDNHDFEEVAFLLVWGHLPNEEERLQFRRNLAQLATPPEIVVQVIKAFPRDTSYHLLYSACMTAWTATDPSKIPVHVGKELYLGKMDFVDETLQRCVAATMTVTALIYCHQQGRELTPPRPDVSLTENSLIMMGLVEKSTNRPSPRMVLFLNRLWILYADHEMTNSTAAGLHCSSTLADPMTSCVASACAGSGPLHAGAINIAYKSFERIGTKDKVPAVIADVKAKKYRLFGYGHRIYKTVDPRVKHLRKMLDEFASEVENDPHLKVAMEIDRIASMDSYFTSRNLKVNADLYGCFVFSAMGFKPEIITALMQAARGVGMLAHWRETMTKPANLWRPLQIFTGNYVSH